MEKSNLPAMRALLNELIEQEQAFTLWLTLLKEYWAKAETLKKSKGEKGVDAR